MLLLWTALLSLAPGVAGLLTLTPTLSAQLKVRIYLLARLVFAAMGLIMFGGTWMEWTPLYLSMLVTATGIVNTTVWLRSATVRSPWRWWLCNELAVAGFVASVCLASAAPDIFATTQLIPAGMAKPVVTPGGGGA